MSFRCRLSHVENLVLLCQCSIAWLLSLNRSISQQGPVNSTRLSGLASPIQANPFASGVKWLRSSDTLHHPIRRVLALLAPPRSCGLTSSGPELRLLEEGSRHLVDEVERDDGGDEYDCKTHDDDGVTARRIHVDRWRKRAVSRDVLSGPDVYHHADGMGPAVQDAHFETWGVVVRVQPEHCRARSSCAGCAR